MTCGIGSAVISVHLKRCFLIFGSWTRGSKLFRASDCYFRRKIVCTLETIQSTLLLSYSMAWLASGKRVCETSRLVPTLNIALGWNVVTACHQVKPNIEPYPSAAFNLLVLIPL